MSSMRFKAALACAALACALSAAGCNAQIYPKPMEPARNPLPPGDVHRWTEGPEEVTVVRHADPVKLRPAGHTAGFPVHFYKKSQRVRAGTAVIVDAGGKAEIVWPLGSSVVLFGPATAVVGSRSRGEPTLFVEDLGRSHIELLEGDLVRLLGGAELSGPSGPYEVERNTREVLLVRNRSKLPLDLAFRSAQFEIGPGQQIELPLVSTGGAPRPSTSEYRTLAGPGFQVDVRGEVESLPAEDAVHVRASGAHELQGLGVRVHLEEGDEAVFSGLARPAAEEPAAQEPPAPAESAAPGRT